MSGPNHTIPEPESEDGGVALGLLDSSDDMETDHESAPTSASQSPTQLPSSFANTSDIIQIPTSQVPSSHEVGGVGSDTPDEASTLLPSFSNLHDNVINTPPTNIAGQHDATFADALSGELLSVPFVLSTHEEEGLTDTLSVPFGTPQSFPPFTNLQPDLSVMQEEENILGGHVGSLGHGTNQPTPVSHSPHLINAQPFDSDVSLPSLTETFGSEFLTQTAALSQSHVTNTEALLDMQDDGADFWDEIEEGIRNFSCDAFFKYWKQMYAHGLRGYPQISDLANKQCESSPEDDSNRPDRILAKDVQLGKHGQHDFQGIYWSRLQTSREEARDVRRMTYSNHMNECDVPSFPSNVSNLGAFGSPGYRLKFSNHSMPSSDAHFEFRETNTRFRSYISHFQLRHSLFASSKSALFYNHMPRKGYRYGAYMEANHACDAKINCFNPETSVDGCVMDFNKGVDRDGAKSFRPYTLTAGAGVLVVGSLEGAYAMKSLSADYGTKPTVGTITDNGEEGSTNHIHNVLDRRSGLPQAVFCSNDRSIRTLDCTTNKLTRTHYFPYAVNCSATSPDGRLRLLVGDHCSPIVSNAETGEVVANLPQHTNFGFACDWAPDGITMATGHQDGFVQVWDARKLSRSIQAIPMEMAGCRTLQFSPVGSGKRVLVIAEPADFVHVVNAQTFESKQVIEFFGEVAGISMPPDGSSLYIANQDLTYGGLMEFERSFGNNVKVDRRSQRRKFRIYDENANSMMNHTNDTVGIEPMIKKDAASCWLKSHSKKQPPFDWLPDSDLDDNDRVVSPRALRNRRGLGLEKVRL